MVVVEVGAVGRSSRCRKAADLLTGIRHFRAPVFYVQTENKKRIQLNIVREYFRELRERSNYRSNNTRRKYHSEYRFAFNRNVRRLVNNRAPVRYFKPEIRAIKKITLPSTLNNSNVARRSKISAIYT